MLTDDRRQQIEELFRRHAKGVGSYVLARVGGDADLAEQITGAVFLIVVRRFDQCRGSPVAWLWSIVRTEIARHFRDRRRDVQSLDAVSAEPHADGAVEPSRRLEQRENEARLRDALARLTDEQQALVYMKFFLDLSNGEVAEALGMTANGVGVAAHRAVKRLRAMMEEPADAPPGATTRGAAVAVPT